MACLSLGATRGLKSYFFLTHRSRIAPTLVRIEGIGAFRLGNLCARLWPTYSRYRASIAGFESESSWSGIDRRPSAGKMDVKGGGAWTVRKRTFKRVEAPRFPNHRRRKRFAPCAFRPGMRPRSWRPRKNRPRRTRQPYKPPDDLSSAMDETRAALDRGSQSGFARYGVMQAGGPGSELSR